MPELPLRLLLGLVVGRGPIEEPGGIFAGPIRLAFRGGADRRSAGGELQTFEDLAGHGWIFDGRDQTHRCSAAGAAQSIHLENTLEKLGPSEPLRTWEGGRWVATAIGGQRITV